MRFAQSIVEGESAETRFVIDYLAELGRPNIIEFANAYQNMKEHWDLSINGSKIDVKGQRRLSRAGGFSEDFAIFEMLNVNGDTGWGYGKADIIAYEFSQEWVLVERATLADFVFDSVDLSEFLHSFDGPLKNYRRKGRKDSYTWISRADVERIHLSKINKRCILK